MGCNTSIFFSQSYYSVNSATDTATDRPLESPDLKKGCGSDSNLDLLIALLSYKMLYRLEKSTLRPI